MNNNKFTAGDTIRLSSEFKTEDGTFIDPSGINLKIKNPNQVVRTFNYPPDISKDDIGKYSIDIKLSIPGEWWYIWESVGSLPGVFEGKFRVISSNVIG